MPRRKGNDETSSTRTRRLGSGTGRGRARQNSTSSLSKSAKALKVAHQLGMIETVAKKPPSTKSIKKEEADFDHDGFNGKMDVFAEDDDSNSMTEFVGEDGNVYQQRNTANARERARMRVLSKAFSKLKTTLPWVPPDTKLSKLDTLRLATSYIAHLRHIVCEDGDDEDGSNGAGDGSVDGDDENDSLDGSGDGRIVGKGFLDGSSSGSTVPVKTGGDKSRHSGAGIHPLTLTWPFMIQRTCSPPDSAPSFKPGLKKIGSRLGNAASKLHHGHQPASAMVPSTRPSPPTHHDHHSSLWHQQQQHVKDEDFEGSPMTTNGAVTMTYYPSDGGHQQHFHHHSAAYWAVNYGSTAGFPHQAGYDTSTGCLASGGSNHHGEFEADFFVQPFHRYTE